MRGNFLIMSGGESGQLIWGTDRCHRNRRGSWPGLPRESDGSSGWSEL